MGKRLTVTQIKNELKQKSNEELIKIICELHKSSKEAADKLNLLLGNDSFVNDEFIKAKEKVEKQFFSQRGMPMLNLKQAKLEIKEFKKMCNEPEKWLDLQLFYVECGIEFTNTFGDIDEKFYNDMENMYETVVETLAKKDDKEMIEKFLPRLEKAISDATGVGWWFSETLDEILIELETYRA